MTEFVEQEIVRSDEVGAMQPEGREALATIAELAVSERATRIFGTWQTALKRLIRSIRVRKDKLKPCVPEGIRLYAIGDIHGRLDLLRTLHEHMIEDAKSATESKIIQIFIGDYVDRGPNSRGVIDWLLKPPPEGWERICLKGNHEEMLHECLKTPETLRSWRRYGGLETLHSYGVDITLYGVEALSALHHDFVAKFPAGHRDFLSNLPLYTEIGDYFFVHAGVRPHRRLDQQRPEDLLWIRHEFVESLEDFGKVVVHGHSPNEEPELLPNRINIDTGAYVTNRLTCLVLENQEQRLLWTGQNLATD